MTKDVALIDMTLTSAACPPTDVIETVAQRAGFGGGLVTGHPSTGCGNCRGARTRSPKTAVNNGGRSASPFETGASPNVELRAENRKNNAVSSRSAAVRAKPSLPQKAAWARAWMSSSMFSMTPRTPAASSSIFVSLFRKERRDRDLARIDRYRSDGPSGCGAHPGQHERRR